MKLREAAVVLALAVCAIAVAHGSAMVHPGAGWIVGGLLFAGLTWLVLAE